MTASESDGGTGRLRGRVALVTGAASRDGIGFATARLFAEQGAKLVITDVASSIQERAAELPPGAEAVWLRHDVREEVEWDAVFARARERFGRVDILVNNAGTTRRSPIDELSIETWRDVVDTNLLGAFLGCRAAVREMRRNGGGGAIVNVASISGVVGMRNSAPYGSSKGGIRSLTKVVALETARDGVRCNVVCPGLIESDIHTAVIAQMPDAHRALVDAIPMGRMGQPHDIAEAVLYLASDAARYVTGSELVVDGGYLTE